MYLDEKNQPKSTFMTAENLGLSQVEFDSLVEVLALLESGKLKKSNVDSNGLFSEGFNMAVARADLSCGTVGCIAGWANKLSNGRAFSFVFKGGFNTLKNKALRELFIPTVSFDRASFSMQIAPFEITTNQAAQALRCYLTTGDSQWSEILKGK